MAGEITNLRKLLANPISRLENVDKLLGDVEAHLPRGPRTLRTRQYIAINKAVVRQECEAAKLEIDQFCNALGDE